MHIYEYNSTKPINSYTGFNSDVTWVRFSYDESRVYAGTFGGTLFVYNYERGKVSNTLRGHLTHTKWVIDQKQEVWNYVMSGAADTNVKIWDLRQKSALATYKGHNKAISALDISPDTKYLASGCTGGVVKIWDITAGKWSYSFNVRNISPSENCFIKDIKFNPADIWMAVASSDKIIRYYDANSFELINESSPDVHPLSTVDFNPDGDVVIGAYHDSIKVWNLEERKLVSMVSKTTRKSKWIFLIIFIVMDCCCSKTTDHTFLLEDVNGSLGLSQISTNLITNNGGEDQKYEEEKRMDASVNQGNGYQNNNQNLNFYNAGNSKNNKGKLV